jgi:ribosome biogenesis protein Nip4
MQANLAQRNSGFFRLQTQEAKGTTMKAIMKFAVQLGARFSLNADFTVNKAGRYFLLNEALLKVTCQDFYYAGTYLGKVKNGKFFPSFNLLTMLAKGEANKIVVEKKAAWLFICGRDIFRKGIVAVYGSRKKGAHALVLNEFGECLGFGRVVGSLDGAKKSEVAVKNISDVGDFLRREA